MKHQRKNKKDSHHSPWKNPRPEECHDHSGGHRGASKGRAAHKRNQRQSERRQGKVLTQESLR